MMISNENIWKINCF